jgi:signal transduction histidine kinase
MIRSLLLVAAAATVLAAVCGAVYGTTAAWHTWALLAGVGGAALAVAHAIAARGRRLGSLRRQFAIGGAVVVGQLLLAAALAAELMFVSPHDALFLVVIALLAAVVAVRAAQLFAGGVQRDVDALRATLASVGDDGHAAARSGSSQDFAELLQSASTAIGRLAQSENARRNLVAAVSHDLRTPITSLQLLAEAVGDEIVDAATRRDYLEQMSRHIAALSALIDDLFELSRLEAGDINWTLQHVRLDQLVEETVDAMRPHADAKGVRVSAVVPGSLDPAAAHPERLQRVLFNLLQNAIRHTPPDGSVTAMAEQADGYLEIEVADTGDGIADGDRVFEPFFRGGTEAARTRASAGLGLAISRAIVEAHGGRIWLEDSPVGARVRFSVPSAAALSLPARGARSRARR